jgi:uncharacterized protein
MLYQRHLKPLIQAACQDTPVVLVNGAHQTGKTTLARELLGAEPEGTYLILDNATTLATAKADPTGFTSEILP